MDSSKRGKCKGVMGFEGGFGDDVGVGNKGSGIDLGGAVGHLSG